MINPEGHEDGAYKPSHDRASKRLAKEVLDGRREIYHLEKKNGELVGCLTASGFAWLIVTVYSFWVGAPDAALLFAILSVGSFVFAWRGDK